MYGLAFEAGSNGVRRELMKAYIEGIGFWVTGTRTLKNTKNVHGASATCSEVGTLGTKSYYLAGYFVLGTHNLRRMLRSLVGLIWQIHECNKFDLCWSCFSCSCFGLGWSWEIFPFSLLGATIFVFFLSTKPAIQL